MADGDLNQVIEVNSDDEFGSLAASFTSMLAALRTSIQKLKDAAYRDKLVDLPNRVWITEQVEKRLDISRADGTELAVLFLDLDGFKEINDVHGHHVGDLLLRAFSERLLDSVTACGLNTFAIEDSFRRDIAICEQDVNVARRGGDEFMLVAQAKHSEPLADAIVVAMKEPLETGDVLLSVTASIGIATFPRHGATSENLMKCADIAMYQSKAAGRNCWQHFDTENHQKMIDERELGDDIREAILQRQFAVFLQPQFDVVSGQVSGAEALLRWHHPTRGLVPPNLFLPMARKIGLMPEIGRQAVGQSIKAAMEIYSFWKEPFTLAINVSVDELNSESFIDDLAFQLVASRLPEKFIEIEITEETAMVMADDIEPRIDALQRNGVRLAIDDFGVGYSNLGRLKKMEFDTLKVDHSLTEGLGTDPGSEDLMVAILDMAEALKTEVVAEGIETDAQLEFLRSHSCRFYQGYLGGKPMPINDFVAFLRNYENLPLLVASQTETKPWCCSGRMAVSESSGDERTHA